ncbi:hypothetical protein BDB01DRAFT_836744 [Pilobolus umbonatus]|nr:hypothetical protein BDB01DRAFT_836744 [Pilobolus umbonatus]
MLRQLAIRRPNLYSVNRLPYQCNTAHPLTHTRNTRHFSLWKIPVFLITATPGKRKMAMAVLGGTGVILSMITGPFFLLGIGGMAAVAGFKVWRFQRQMKRWPDFLQDMINPIFGQDQVKLENEVVTKVEGWGSTTEGRSTLIDYGINPDNLKFSLRGSSTSEMNNKKEMTIELDVVHSPGWTLVAVAQLNEHSNIHIQEMKLVSSSSKINIPLSQGRIIEGEFRDLN